MNNQFQIEIYPYKRHLMVFYLATWEQIVLFYEKNDLPLPDKEEVIRPDLKACVVFHSGNWIMFINSSENIGPLVAHECCHIAFNLFSYIGEDNLRTYEKNEPFCYLVENLMTRVLDAINRI